MINMKAHLLLPGYGANEGAANNRNESIYICRKNSQPQGMQWKMGSYKMAFKFDFKDQNITKYLVHGHMIRTQLSLERFMKRNSANFI